jgi:hypothetical protein
MSNRIVKIKGKWKYYHLFKSLQLKAQLAFWMCRGQNYRRIHASHIHEGETSQCRAIGLKAYEYHSKHETFSLTMRIGQDLRTNMFQIFHLFLTTKDSMIFHVRILAPLPRANFQMKHRKCSLLPYTPS